MTAWDEARPNAALNMAPAEMVARNAARATPSAAVITWKPAAAMKSHAKNRMVMFAAATARAPQQVANEMAATNVNAANARIAPFVSVFGQTSSKINGDAVTGLSMEGGSRFSGSRSATACRSLRS